MICFGIDVAVAHVAIAATSNGTLIDTAHVRLPGKYTRGTFPDRTADLQRLTREALDGMADEHPPAYVLVEQPVGKFNAPTLMAAWGVVTAAAVTVAARQGGVVGWATPSAWRSAAGAGRNKADGLARATAAGYTGTDEDIADAICIALAAETQVYAAL